MSVTQVQTSGINNDAVTVDKIADNAVGTSQIANGAVTNAKIADNAVGTSQIANDAVTVDKISDNAVGTSQIANDAVTPQKLSNPLTRETSQSASGTSVDFTGIPSWVKRITVMLNNVSFSAPTNNEYLMFRIGDSGGIETTGYGCYAIFTALSGQNAIDGLEGFLVYSTPVSVNAASGVLTLNNISGNTWVSTHEFARINNIGSPNGCRGSGSKTLSGTLNRINITTRFGTGTFISGTINILYE
jgi:hypothetical protein